MLDARVIEVYSKILYDKSIESKSLDKVVENIKNIVEVIDSSTHLKRFFGAPIHDVEVKLSVIETLDKKIKFEPLSKNFLKTLVCNNRMEYIGAIHKRLVELELGAKNITCAILTSARSMSAKEMDRCKEMLEQKLEKKFDMEHIVDPSIIGGVTLKFGSNLYDTSVAGASKNLIREINEA